MEQAMTTRPCSEPLAIVAEQGHVLIEARGGVTLTMTPDAALASADRLADEAATANGQKIMSGISPGLTQGDKTLD
jgi:hypothetical protein